MTVGANPRNSVVILFESLTNLLEIFFDMNIGNIHKISSVIGGDSLFLVYEPIKIQELCAWQMETPQVVYLLALGLDGNPMVRTWLHSKL